MQDYATQIREAAVASLIAYGTLAGSSVESERVDKVAPGDMPRLLVFGDDEASGQSEAGGPPVFEVTLTLVVQALVERAQKPDAVADLDTMIAQIKDALLSDPVWVKMSARIGSVRVTRAFRGEDQQIIGDARVQITCLCRETYPPRIPDTLGKIVFTERVPSGTTPVTVEVDLPQS